MSRVEEKVVNAGVEVWRDRDRRCLPSASNWRVEAEKAIASIRDFVFFISPDSLLSPQCQWELALAIQYQKRLVPVVCLDARMKSRVVRSGEMHEALSSLNWITFERSFDEGVFDLISVLSQTGQPILKRVQHFLWIIQPQNSFRHELFRGKHVIGRAPFYLAKEESFTYPQAEQNIRYREALIRLSKEESPLVIVDDAAISRRHATIFKQGDGYIVMDGDCRQTPTGFTCERKSIQGLRVDGTLLRQGVRVELTNGLRIELTPKTHLSYEQKGVVKEGEQLGNDDDTVEWNQDE